MGAPVTVLVVCALVEPSRSVPDVFAAFWPRSDPGHASSKSFGGRENKTVRGLFSGQHVDGGSRNLDVPGSWVPREGRRREEEDRLGFCPTPWPMSRLVQGPRLLAVERLQISLFARTCALVAGTGGSYR